MKLVSLSAYEVFSAERSFCLEFTVLQCFYFIVHRLVGGLEKDFPGIAVKTPVHRLVGGLERLHAPCR